MTDRVGDKSPGYERKGLRGREEGEGRQWRGREGRKGTGGGREGRKGRGGGEGGQEGHRRGEGRGGGREGMEVRGVEGGGGGCVPSSVVDDFVFILLLFAC